MPEKNEPKTSHIGVPLRRAGQHLDQQLRRLLASRMLFFCLVTGAMAGFALTEWAHSILHQPSVPYLATLLALVTALAGGIVLNAALNRSDQLELGSRGEKVVADALEPLRALGYAVFHDIPGNGFNLDHVLVGPGGVFVIETKARSKRGNETITYRRDEILVNGMQPDRDPLVQVKASRNWLAGVIKESCALEPPMRGVVLFPGWFIEGSSSGREVWVLNEKILPRFIEQEDAVLSEGDVARIASMLASRSRGGTGGN